MTTAEWSVLRKRIGRQDTKDEMFEWFMPLDDKVGKVAWRKWAESLDAKYVGGKEPGVAWNFPLIPRMRRALALAEAQFHGDQKNALLGRVVRDLRSYRDTGYSVMSPDKPSSKRFYEENPGLATAKTRKKPAP